MKAIVETIEVIRCACGKRWRLCRHCGHKTPLPNAHGEPMHPSYPTRIDCNQCGAPTFPEDER